MSLPNFPELSEHTLRQIAGRIGINPCACQQLPSVGVFNAIYQLGENHILRVPRNHPYFISAIAREAVAVPQARAAGLRTPALIAFDDSLTLLPVPYAIYERVSGVPLESLPFDSRITPGTYRILGQELARLHTGVKTEGPVASLGEPNLPLGDPVSVAHELAVEGYFTNTEADWLVNWLQQLCPLLTQPADLRFLHGDTQATNILVDPDSHHYQALIDWGGCGWGDPVLDFSGMPLRFVPDVLAGYREIACLPADETAESRILRYHLYFALINLRSQPQPQRSWGERPFSYLLAVMHFTLTPPNARWAALHP